jgi:hypothetical protein
VRRPSALPLSHEQERRGARRNACRRRRPPGNRDGFLHASSDGDVAASSARVDRRFLTRRAAAGPSQRRRSALDPVGGELDSDQGQRRASPATASPSVLFPTPPTLGSPPVPAPPGSPAAVYELWRRWIEAGVHGADIDLELNDGQHRSRAPPWSRSGASPTFFPIRARGQQPRAMREGNARPLQPSPFARRDCLHMELFADAARQALPARETANGERTRQVPLGRSDVAPPQRRLHKIRR